MKINADCSPKSLSSAPSPCCRVTTGAMQRPSGRITVPADGLPRRGLLCLSLHGFCGGRRSSYGIEIDPLYCDVIIRRLRAVCGLEAFLESAGKLFEEIEAERCEGSRFLTEKLKFFAGRASGAWQFHETRSERIVSYFSKRSGGRASPKSRRSLPNVLMTDSPDRSDPYGGAIANIISSWDWDRDERLAQALDGSRKCFDPPPTRRISTPPTSCANRPQNVARVKCLPQNVWQRSPA